MIVSRVFKLGNIRVHKIPILQSCLPDICIRALLPNVGLLVDEMYWWSDPGDSSLSVSKISLSLSLQVLVWSLCVVVTYLDY